MAHLGSVSDVELLYGKPVDADQAAALLERATTLLYSRIGRVFADPATAPADLHVACAQVVANFLACRDSQQSEDGSQVRAEQIGDYRVEFNRARPMQSACSLDVDAVESLWSRYRLRCYSVGLRVPTASEGSGVVPLAGPAYYEDVARSRHP